MFALVFAFQSFISYSMVDIFICIFLGLMVYLLEIKAFKLIDRYEMDYVLSVIPVRFSLIRNIIKNLAYEDKKQLNDKKFRLIK